MSHLTYIIVEHDGGWAYKVGDVFSETFPTRQAAHAAAEQGAQEQRAPGERVPIEYGDSAGRWHEEDEKGDDRPDTEVKAQGLNIARCCSAARMSEFVSSRGIIDQSLD